MRSVLTSHASPAGHIDHGTRPTRCKTSRAIDRRGRPDRPAVCARRRTHPGVSRHALEEDRLEVGGHLAHGLRLACQPDEARRDTACRNRDIASGVSRLPSTLISTLVNGAGSSARARATWRSWVTVGRADVTAIGESEEHQRRTAAEIARSRTGGSLIGQIERCDLARLGSNQNARVIDLRTGGRGGLAGADRRQAYHSDHDGRDRGHATQSGGVPAHPTESPRKTRLRPDLRPTRTAAAPKSSELYFRLM